MIKNKETQTRTRMSNEQKKHKTYCEKCPTVFFKKERGDAVIPSRAYPTDMGYDLTVVDVYKRVSERITIFETGISVAPPEGYYTEILPRSSASKTGHVLANSVGIIDPSYRGSLKIAVIKVDDSLPDLVPPFSKHQLILRKANHFNMVETTDLDKTERGDGGFGSTDSLSWKEMKELLCTGC